MVASGGDSDLASVVTLLQHDLQVWEQNNQLAAICVPHTHVFLHRRPFRSSTWISFKYSSTRVK